MKYFYTDLEKPYPKCNWKGCYGFRYRIVEDLQVSHPTVYKAMAEYNLQETRYSDISEADIQHAVSSIKENHPNAGEVMLQGHLRAQQIHVQRSNMQGYT